MSFVCARATQISAKLALITGLYAFVASLLVIFLLALREKVDKKGGLFFIFIYLLSYTTIYLI